MPYITPGAQVEIDNGRLPETSGELTYVIQQSLKQYLEGTGLRYAALAECLGVLEGAKLDLIDRVIVPYEHQKRVENGDVWPEELLS